jgi:hypothetical protein
MSNYNRTTRECSVSQLHPELRQAVQSYFQEHNLGDPETESLMCCETISEKKNVSKLVSWLGGGSDATIHTGILFTSEWLIWARRGDQSGTVLNAASLKEIQVRAYESVITKETGLEIYGKIGASKGIVRGFVGVGEDLVAQKFIETVVNKINELNPPTKKEKKGFLARWLSPRE